MKMTDLFNSRVPLALLLAGLVLAVSPAADAQRVSLQGLLDRIEALEGDGTEVKITEAFAAFSDTTCKLPNGAVPDTIEIRGANFDRAGDATSAFPNLVVTFGDLGKLILCPARDNPSATQIRAALPANVAPGDYLVAVSVGDGVGDRAEHLHTIGATGPEGPQGVQGPQGETGTSLRVETFGLQQHNTCQYTAAASIPAGAFPACSCSCEVSGLGGFGPSVGSCGCSCTSTVAASNTQDRCTSTVSPLTCPDVGGAQGQSAVIACSGTPSSGNSCNFSSLLTGFDSSCTITQSATCNCTRLAFSNGFGSCSCTPDAEVLAESCVGPTRTAQRFDSAICIKAVPVAGGG